MGFRKWLLTTGILLLLAGTGGAAFAETPVRLSFGGQKVGADVKAITRDGFLYVNLPFLNRVLHIMTAPNIESGDLFLQFGKWGIKLYRDQSVYYVNGVRRSLAAAPFETGGQLWLPLEFLLKLGLAVITRDKLQVSLDWDQNYLLEVGNVTYQNHPAFLLSGAKNLDPKDYLLANPDRLVIELPETLPHEAFDSRIELNPLVKRVRLEKDDHLLKLIFDLNQKVAYHVVPAAGQRNQVLIVFDSGPDGGKRGPEAAAASAADRRPAQSSQAKPLSGKTVLLDPGHGGADEGAAGRQGTLEKENNLEIALRLKGLLERAGAAVLLTRTDDYFIGLYERSFMANETGVDLFISIHTNFHPDFSMHGIGVYYDPGHPGSDRLGRCVLEQITRSTGFSGQGVIREDFAVTRETQMTGILVETGFLSNIEEENIIRTPEFKGNAAQGIYQGVLQYFAQTSGTH